MGTAKHFIYKNDFHILTYFCFCQNQLQFKKRQEMVQRAWEEQVEEKQAKEKEENIRAEQDRIREEEAMKKRAKIAEEEAVQRQRKIDEWKEAIEAQKTELDRQQKEEDDIK